MSTDITIDAKGISCPMVILKAKREIKDLPSGSVVELLANDPMSEYDVSTFCNAVGHELLDVTKASDVLRFLIRIK